MGQHELGWGRQMLLPALRLNLGSLTPFNLAEGKSPFLLTVVLQQPLILSALLQGRGGEELSTELSAALQRCLLGGRSGEGAGIDLSSLVILEGKVCWDLYIDGLVVSSDGSLLDALAAAMKAALSNTGIPQVNVAVGASPDEQPEVNISDEEFLQFDTSAFPVIITLTKVGKEYIVDATLEEESQISSAISVSLNRHGKICGLIKRGGAGLDPSVILDMISVAKHVSQQLISLLDAEIDAAEAAYAGKVSAVES